MVDDVIIPSLKMGASYEQYLLGTAFARPIIAKKLVEIAKAEGADAIAHGCTGKGNDQVRFELTIKRFAPEMTIIAPWREWDIKGRDEEIDCAEAHNVPLKISRETNYSKDRNLWGAINFGCARETTDFTCVAVVTCGDARVDRCDITPPYSGKCGCGKNSKRNKRNKNCPKLIAPLFFMKKGY